MSTVVTPEGLLVDGKRVQLLRDESGGQAWQHRAVAGLAVVTDIEGDEWQVDEWGDLQGEDLTDHPKRWEVDLDGGRLTVEAGCLLLRCDVHGDAVESYREAGLRLLAALDAFNDWEPPWMP